MEVVDVKANSQRQLDFLAAPEDDVLFGGAAGCGKSMVMVYDPMKYRDVTDYTAIIFRESYPELEKSIMPYTSKYYNAAGATYNDQKHCYTWPGSNAKIWLGHLDGPEAWRRYQGAAMCGQYFDELTTIHWRNFQQLKMWNRTLAPSVRPYRRASSNPTGISHSQVKEYFVDACPAIPDGPMRWSALAKMWWQPMRAGRSVFERQKNGEGLTKKFIPGRIFDNLDILRDNPNYLARLLSMDESQRRAFLEGDWDVFEGQFFGMWRDAYHHVEDLPLHDREFRRGFEGWNKLGVIDYGERTVLEVGVRDYEGNITCFLEVFTEAQTPTDRFNAMADALIELELWNVNIKCDTNMAINLKHYSGYDKTPLHIAKDVFESRMKDRAPNLSIVSKSTTDRRGYRVVCNEAVKEYLRWTRGEDGFLLERPKLYVADRCRMLRKTLPELIHDPLRNDGLDFNDKVGMDDPFDAMKMMVMGLYSPRALPVQKKYEGERAMNEWMKDNVFDKIVQKAGRRKVNADTL